MSVFRKSQPNATGPRRPQARAAQADPKPGNGPDLFPIAVFIMGIVSCYTTAVGLYPMLGNWVLSYATAFALSTFMVAIALRIPKAYLDGNQYKLIAGYIFVALFSVLLNFNAIFGVFSSEKLLYEELKNAKQELTAIEIKAQEALDAHFGAVETQRKLDEARAMLEEETTNRVDPGYGQNAREINQEKVIPLRAELAAIRAKYDPLTQQIDTVVSSAITRIDQALASEDLASYRKAVDYSVDAYNQVGISTQNLIGSDNFTYQPLAFQHRDVGNLNHSLWTVMNLHKLDGKQASSVIVSLLLSFLIDFIVLFVLVMINRPGKGDLNGPDAPKDAEEASASGPASGNAQGRQSFQRGQTEAEQQRRQTIYARRSERRRDERGAQLNRHQVNRAGEVEPPLYAPLDTSSVAPTPEPQPEAEAPEMRALPARGDTHPSDFPDETPPVWPSDETGAATEAAPTDEASADDLHEQPPVWPQAEASDDGMPPQWEKPGEQPEPPHQSSAEAADETDDQRDEENPTRKPFSVPVNGR